MKKIRFLAFLLLLTAVLCACGVEKAPSDTTAETVLTTEATVETTTEAQAFYTRLILCDLGDPVPLHTNLQSDYLLDGYARISMYAKGTEELSRPQPVALTWELDTNEDRVLKPYTVLVSENPDFTDPILETTTKKTTVSLNNLYLGKTYYWSVSAEFEDGEILTEIASFTTDTATPRNLYVSGATNFRDLGGWVTEDGGKVRQGLLYRGGKISGKSGDKNAVVLTSAGASVLVNDLGIRTEIDLRQESEGGAREDSVLGDKTRYVSLPMDYSGDMLVDNVESIRAFFALLADESNYPLFYHCSIGTDRTGMMSYLVNGLLGVKQTSLYRDYLFSNFGLIGGSRSIKAIAEKYVKILSEAEGDTLQEKIYNYLVGIGIPETQLDEVIRILKEPAKTE